MSEHSDQDGPPVEDKSEDSVTLDAIDGLQDPEQDSVKGSGSAADRQPDLQEAKFDTFTKSGDEHVEERDAGR
ncbi:hypothetical protein [Mariniluteicoccus flavus]